MRRLTGWLGPVFASLAFCTVANAQSRFETYFLTVGSSAYIKPSAPNEHGFPPNLGGMNTSAQLVGDILSRNGAVSGIVLTSTASSFVSRGDFESALSALVARVRSDHPAHPLVVVYLAGHGISEGVAWTHFSVPGNFVYGPPLERLDIEAVAQHTIYAAGVADVLDQLKVPYMLLLDSCYSGKAADFTSPFLSPTAIGNLRDIAAVLRFINEFHQSNPVVFSTPPGTEVLPAEDPRDPLHSLGPIARRLLLLTREATVTGKNFTLSATVGRLLAADLDGGTAPPISNTTPSPLNSILIGRAVTSHAAIEERQGSATMEDVCCGHGSAAVPAASSHSYRLYGTLAFEGPSGEFVSNGRKISLPPATVVDVVEPDAHSLELSFGGPESWELDLSVPADRQIERGRYTDAQRYPFQNAGLPGLAFSGDGRACNEVSGEFAVTGIQRAASGRITNLTAVFAQACDGKPATVRGTVKLNAP